MATQGEIDEAKAAGWATPSGAELIRDGDDAITENAARAHAQRWDKGHAGTTGLDSFSTGVRQVWSGVQAESLGLPFSFQCTVTTLWWGTGNAYGLQEAETIEPTPRIWKRRYVSGAWEPWIPPFEPTPFVTVIRTSTHEGVTFEDLPDGAYFNDRAPMMTQLGLPFQVCVFRKYTHPDGYGLAEALEWVAPNRTMVNRRTTGGWLGWALPSGGGGSGDIPWHQEDTAAFTGMLLDQDHHGTGYAINTQNWPGARTGWVGHQYSNERPFMVIDNCRSQPSIQINNTQNTTITPDFEGDGDFFQLGPWDDVNNYNRWLRFGNDLVWRNDTKQRMGFQQVYDAGDILRFYNQAGAQVAAIAGDGSWVQASPNGSLWKITVSDTGALTASAL